MEVSDYCIISTATDSKENADAMTQLLLEKNLVACDNRPPYKVLIAGKET